jgi:hypothetical protein
MWMIPLMVEMMVAQIIFGMEPCLTVVTSFVVEVTMWQKLKLLKNGKFNYLIIILTKGNLK